MRTIDPLLAEAMHAKRKAEADLAHERAFTWQRKARAKLCNNAENIYRLFNSNQPTEELRTMSHMEAVTINKKMMDDFRAKVVEAIDNGSRYEGKISAWRIYKHHTEIEGEKPLSPEARKAAARAIQKLTNDLTTRRLAKKQKQKSTPKV
jgi:hypothetical protein